MDSSIVSARVAGSLKVALFFLGCGGSSMHMAPDPTSLPSSAHAGARFLYVVNSIEATVQQFSIDGTTGTLTSSGPAVAAGDAPLYAAATPNGRFLYVAKAGTNAIGVSGYRIDQAGTVMAVPGTPATGRGPIGTVLSGRQ